MEAIKSSIRPYKVNEHYKQSLTKGYEYYRVRLHSLYKEAGTTNVDATFDVKRVFPNHRADLLNGECRSMSSPSVRPVCASWPARS